MQLFARPRAQPFAEGPSRNGFERVWNAVTPALNEFGTFARETATAAGHSLSASPCPAVTPRRLTREDRQLVLEHLLRLCAEDRRMRFCRAFTDDNVAHYVAGIDFESSVCFGVLDFSQSLIALAQSFAYDHGATRLIEAAFSTDAPFRRRGLGANLFRQVTDFAIAHGADCVIAQCLAGNYPMRALLHAVGAVCAIEDGEVTAQWEVFGHA
jgi:RimJ/RimL family protein N-acetyltransferase